MLLHVSPRPKLNSRIVRHVLTRGHPLRQRLRCIFLSIPTRINTHVLAAQVTLPDTETSCEWGGAVRSGGRDERGPVLLELE